MTNESNSETHPASEPRRASSHKSAGEPRRASSHKSAGEASSKSWHPPTATERKAILDASTSIAIVGASANPARASNFVATYLLSSSTDFDVYLVNPREDTILGQPVYPSLADLPTTPDIVDVFRKSADLPDVADEAIAVGAPTFWAQLGLWNMEAAERCTEAGMQVVMDRCTKIEHARFHGGLHLAGFDTGVISSRRAT